ncbi:hypothetical protein SPRG_05194 [Saprolegnia parasitica CBS 223.65]|uniref:Transmembrane protein n=1 Tax=Saprolegnia parasitica (strain CBS 223.65) TaxID=695850 RepID=A0A067CLB1_SAPPC|nr:hypothetical protein SPRG_05194 [Saprolegnia parasitica CBS 223.65]KDO30005.1 hypothetical protein SPRG_05194 [Saprolegnia parasitica CBS 223.65]|eukprot:XP_012199188.1 hypothetical protein SPRG_05194 [Saprolegnia parasitica CBS 223.65]
MEVLLFFNRWFTLLYVLLTGAIFVYKGMYLPYPPTGAYTWEVIFLCLYYIIDRIRIFQASKGNKTEQVFPLVTACLLTLPCVISLAYYISLQTYVLQLDVILNAIGLVFLGLESIFGPITTLRLLRASRF